MSKRFTQQLLSAIIMAGAAAIPVVTTAAIINQSLTASGGGATPAAPVAALPRSSGAGSGTTTSSTGHGTYQGPVVQQPYGAVQAAVTISNGKIAMSPSQRLRTTLCLRPLTDRPFHCSARRHYGHRVPT